MAIVVRTLAFAALAVFSAGAIYSAGALAINAASDRLSPHARALCWRILAVKLAGVALITITLATSANT